MPSNCICSHIHVYIYIYIYTYIYMLVLGHSHAYWLGAFIESAGLLDDLERLGHTCTIRFMGRMGASIKTFREPATVTRISAHVPDIVITLLGGNDLDGKFPPPPEAVGSHLGRLGDELLAVGVRQVCLCLIERHKKWRHFDFDTGAARVASANAALQSACGGGRCGLFYWSHKYLWNSPAKVSHQDGVHLSDIGNFRLFRSIRGAIFRAVNWIVQQLTDA